MKRAAYFFYLNSYRSTAFLESLAARCSHLFVVDFSPLRSLYRRQRVQTRAYRESQVARLKSVRPEIRARYIACPQAQTGYHQLDFFLTLAMSIGLALAIPLFLAFQRLDRVVFYNGHLLFAMAWAYARVRRIPVTTDLGDVLYLLDNPNALTRGFERHFVRRSASVICVTPLFRHYLIAELGLEERHVHVISAAVPNDFPQNFDLEANRDRKARLRQWIGAEPDAMLWVYAGGIWKKKLPGRGWVDVQGVFSLCLAHQIVNQRGSPCYLIILGFSLEDPDLRPFRESPYSSRLVEYGRYQAGDERHLTCLGGADFLCLPSASADTYHLYDRFKTFEYLAAGKRILCADTPLNRLLLSEEGVFYREEEAADMASKAIDAWSQAAGDPPDFIEAANRRVRQRYTWQPRVESGAIGRAIFDTEPILLY